MDKKKIIIYGIGSMARTYASYLKFQFELCAYTIKNDFCNQDHFNHLPLIPFEELEKVYPPSEYALIVAVGYIEMNEIRQNVSQQAKQKGYKLISYVHDDFIFHDEVTVGDNTVIFDKSSIHCGTKIGNNVFISSGVNIGHDCIIGDNVWINSGVSIAGGVIVNDNCFLGVNSSIGHTVILEKQVFVGANTLVTKNISEEQVVISNSAEIFPFKSKRYLKISQVTANV